MEVAEVLTKPDTKNLYTKSNLRSLENIIYF